MPEAAAKINAAGSCEEALRDLLLAVAGPDNFDALLRKITRSLSRHKAMRGGLGLVLAQGNGLAPLIISSNLTKNELRALGGTSGARAECFKGFLTAPIRGGGEKGSLLARAGSNDRACAAELLKIAAKTISGRLERDARERVLSAERDVADAITHLEELYLNFPDISIEEISRLVLDEACRLTHSPMGFAGYINEDTGALHVPAFNYGELKHPGAEGEKVVFRKFTGLWGWVLKNKKPLLTNSAASDPRAASLAYGHAAIERFAAAPAISGKKLLGILTLANPPADYPPSVLNTLTKLARAYALMLCTKRAEQQRLFDNEKYQATIESSQDLIYTLNAEGKLVFVNQAARAYGYEPREVVGRHFSCFVHPGDRERVCAAFSKTVKTASPAATLTYRLLKKDGSFANIEQKSSKLRHHGSAPLVVGVMRDLTGAMRAEEKDRKYKTLIESTDFGYHVLDSRGRVTDANKEYLRLTGRRRMEDILGKSVTEWTAPHDRKRTRLELGKCLKLGFARNLILDYADVRGNITPVEINATVLKHSGSFQIISLCRDITQRRLSESELKEQSALLKAQQEASPDAILVVDKDARIRSYNKQFASLWGIPGQVLLSRSDKLALEAVIDKIADPQAFLRKVAHLYAHPNEESRDEIRLKDGRVLERFTTSVRGPGREFYGRIWHFRDISARRKTEELLRQSEQRFRMAMEQLNGILWVLDRDLRFTLLRGQGLSTLGLKPDQTLGMPLKIFMQHTGRGDALLSAHARALLGDNVSYEERLGDTPFSVVLSPLKDASGKITGVVGLAIDITEKKALGRKLKENEETLNQIFENTAEAIFIKDTRDLYLKANKACADIFLTPPEKMIGRTTSEVFGRETADQMRKDDLETIRQKKTVLFNREYKTPAGNVYLSTSRTPLLAPDGKIKGILGIVRDITAIKNMETKAALAKASEVMSNAAGPLTHDFNNALAAINGYAMIIDDEISAADPIKKEIGQIIKAVNRAAEITSRLQSLAKTPLQEEQGDKKPDGPP